MRATLLGLAALLAMGAGADAPSALVAKGEAAWARREEPGQKGLAASGPISEAISAYEQALEASPGSIEIRELLLRALFFQGRYATPEGPQQRAIYARGRDVAEEGLAQLAAEMGRQAPFDSREPEKTARALSSRPESAALFFWAGGYWGLWGETSGIFTAVRQGVVKKVRDYGKITILVDESYWSAGGLLIQGRLNTRAPRIPLFTGWIDRDLAVSSLERAVELAPDEPVNRLYLADALLRFRPKRRAEAVTMLEAILAEPPRPGMAFHDGFTHAQARRILARSGS